MEVAALADEPLPVPSRGYSTTPAVDADLRQRIRSLLISRNQHNPPRTPCVTPEGDYNYLEKCDRIASDSGPGKAKKSFSPSAANARLQQLSSNMGAIRFDGPGGKDLDEDPNLQRRPSKVSRRLNRDSSFDDAGSTPLLGVDRRAQGDVLGRESRIPDVINWQKSSSLAAARRPRFHLRTVPPAVDVNKVIRPVAQHVPGSYRSEVLSPRDRAVESLQEIVSHEDPTSATQNLSSKGPQRVSSELNILTQESKDTSNGIGLERSEIYTPASPSNQHDRKASQIFDKSLEAPKLVAESEDSKLIEKAIQAPSKTPSLLSIPLTDKSVVGIQSSQQPNDRNLYTTPTGEAAPPENPSPLKRAVSLLSTLSARRSSLTPSTKSLRPRAGSQQKAGSNLTRRPSHHRAETAQGPMRTNSNSQTDRPGNHLMPKKHPYRALASSESNSENIRSRQDQRADPSFSKVIEDIESLLTDALSIAGHAAGKDSHQHLKKRVYSDSSLSSSSTEDEDDVENQNAAPKETTINAKGHVRIEEPAAEEMYHGHFTKTRKATPYPAQTRNPSTVTSNTDRPVAGPPNIIGTSLEVPDSETPTWALENRKNSQNLSSRSTEAISPGTRLKESSSKPDQFQSLSMQPPTIQVPEQERHGFHVREQGAKRGVISRGTFLEQADQRPPIAPRVSSVRHTNSRPGEEQPRVISKRKSENSGSDCVPYFADFTTSGVQYHPVYQTVAQDFPSRPSAIPQGQESLELRPVPTAENPEKTKSLSGRQGRSTNQMYKLDGRSHVSISEPHGFSLSRFHRRQPIARDWSNPRKRFVATVTCITTTFIGFLVGIYAGEVPAIQYALADEHHYVILGNVLLYTGLALTTALFYPLPLLHGRKTYTLAALAILLPLQFPQALAINAPRSPYISTYRVGLLLPRIFAGVVAGFVNINLLTTLLDLFGASLQSGNPHQEIVNYNDVRRHGGGIGVWLGIWTFCAIGSIGIGFLIGAGIISGLDVSWGYWITIILNAAVLVLNILSPEVRRATYRKSMAEVRNGADVSRRVARGEIKMHLEATGPVWWWEEVWAGHVLAIRMFVQPGFAVLSLYVGWIYGQVVLVIVLLGALLSKYYRFHPQYVGLSVAIIPLGALLAVPFQKASLFSRSRHHAQRTDSMTFEKRVTWTSHLVRRAIFMITLPFAGMAYTLSSGGPPTHFMIPIAFAGLIGFLSNLATAECYGIMMETYDTSDLQPGMTGRPRRVLSEETKKKRTNFSCFPRVTAGFAISQTFAFAIAAAVTGWGGVAERHLGAQTATAVMAGILLGLTLLLIGVLWRFKIVQIIPSERFGTNILSGPEDEWKPIIIGNPSGTTRRMSLLELGSLSRWSEIRRRNKLGPTQR